MAIEIKELTDNGFTRQQVIVLVDALAKTQQEVRKQVVTKDYLDTRVADVRCCLPQTEKSKSTRRNFSD